MQTCVFHCVYMCGCSRLVTCSSRVQSVCWEGTWQSPRFQSLKSLSARRVLLTARVTPSRGNFDWTNIVACVWILFPSSAPPTALLPSARYEKIIEAFGGCGYFVKTPQELNLALKKAFETTSEASLINVMVDPFSQRKQQVLSDVNILMTYMYKQSLLSYFFRNSLGWQDPICEQKIYFYSQKMGYLYGISFNHSPMKFTLLVQ